MSFPSGTTRSFCRICTAICGIVVETDGESHLVGGFSGFAGMVRYSGVPVTLRARG